MSTGHKLTKIAQKARAGEELTDEEIEYVAKAIAKLGPFIEQLVEWLRPTLAAVIAVFIEELKKLEEGPE